MNHKVEHNADIGAAARPRAGAHAIDGNRGFVKIEQAGTAEHEAFLVADGQHAAIGFGQRDQVFGLVQIGGDGLFHQHMGAGFEKFADNAAMRARGRANAHHIDMAQKTPPVGGCGNMEMGFGAVPRVGVRIGKADQLYACETRIFRAVMPPEYACPYHAGPQNPLAGKPLAIQYTQPLI